MEVPLTQGKVAVIDDADWPIVAPYRRYASKQPNGRFYAIANLWNPEKYAQDKIRMHRLILGITDPAIKVDHRNLDGLLNRRENIRACTNAENIRNRPKGSTPTSSKYKGVSWASFREKWTAQIVVNKKHIILGNFDSEEDAARAYNDGATRYFAEFARLNVLPAA
jgi:hypothetical protein